MIWLRSIRDVAAELIGAAAATLYPLDAQVRVTETQEVPMADVPKVVIPVEFDFTEARKQLAEFCGHDTPQRVVIGFDGSKSDVGPVNIRVYPGKQGIDELREQIYSRIPDWTDEDTEGAKSAPTVEEFFTAKLRPNYHEDTRLVDIVAQFGYIEYRRGLGSSKSDNWAELTDITKNSWRRAAREQLEELNR